MYVFLVSVLSKGQSEVAEVQVTSNILDLKSVNVCFCTPFLRAEQSDGTGVQTMVT